MLPSDAMEHHPLSNQEAVAEAAEEVVEAVEEVVAVVEEVHQLQPLKALSWLRTMLKQWEASLKSSLETDSKPTTSSKKLKDTSV